MCATVKIKTMSRYSAYTLLRNAFSGHRHWNRAWRDPEPAKHYDIIIIGAGGHGLATAYYLAKHHGITNVVVLEKSYLGGGNSGRNTQVCRSNYFYPQSGAFYEHSLKLFECLGQVTDPQQVTDRATEIDLERVTGLPQDNWITFWT